MKRILCLLLALLFLTLCACLPANYVRKLDGVWQGDGAMEYEPLVGVNVLTFRDGTLIAEGGMGAGEYTVSATDDTLTVSRDPQAGAFGLSYKIKGDTLILCGKFEFQKVG